MDNLPIIHHKLLLHQIAQNNPSK